MIVLQTIENIDYSWGFGTFQIVMLLASVTLFVLVINMPDVEAAAAASGICLVLALATASQYNENISYTQQVYLNETVNMEEFAKNYEIIEQQGVTYIIKEKD